jgi:hypothetical protein
MRKEGSKRGWWSTYRLPLWLQSYVGFESDARELLTCELELIPALLQTEAYARRTHTLAVHMTTPAEIDRLVEARLRRQERLVEPSPLAFSAVISEAALQRTLGDKSLAAGQLRHLLTMAEKPNISLAVLPFDVGLHQSMSGSFTVLKFAPEVSEPVAYMEHAVGGHLVDDQEILTRLISLFDVLQKQALSPADSLRLIADLVQRIEGEV